MSTETDHEHDFGPMEIAPMTGNPHRKCQVEGCRVVSLDFDDDETETDEVDDTPRSVRALRVSSAWRMKTAQEYAHLAEMALTPPAAEGIHSVGQAIAELRSAPTTAIAQAYASLAIAAATVENTKALYRVNDRP